MLAAFHWVPLEIATYCAVRGIVAKRTMKPAGHVENGVALLAKAVKLELEGIVAKRADSIYTAGRSRQWLKIKTRAGQEREAIRLRHLRQ